MKRSIVHVWILPLFLLALLSADVLAVTASEYATVINLAGRQRMLTQKMSKEVLLVALGHDADANKANLRNTASLFDRTLKGLKDGDSARARERLT